MNKTTSIDKIFDVICGNSIAVAMFFSVFICSCHNVFAAGAAGRTVAGTIIASGNGATDGSSAKSERRTVKEQCIVGEYHNTITADARARRARRGIIIVGSGSNTRAMEPYGGSIEKALGYAATVNKYRSQFDGGINIYCMPIPNAVEYYCPDNARGWTGDERAAINGIFASLSDSVKAVDIYTTLGNHATEPIYSRTDHHWAPLGAYYAAEQFAGVAGVPFKPLSEYDEYRVRDYVGTMYRFSRDIAVKRAPEEFVYYVPRDVEYTTTYINYTLDRTRTVVTAEAEPCEGSFFRNYSDGSSGAYCTFMGGDTKTVAVRTSTRNGRRLMILKDSYGNALPGYLFGSFEEIHVVDCRYFTKNIIRYVDDNAITDILFANNLIHASMEKTHESYEKYLVQ